MTGPIMAMVTGEEPTAGEFLLPMAPSVDVVHSGAICMERARKIEIW